MAKGDPDAEFEEQEIILTVPASFDEVARTLTAEAARQAGILKVTLLEEPQAAFYSWIAQQEDSLKKKPMRSGETILVCDVGGGTTDFSLIEAIEKGETITFQRISIGDHLLLGGDNMDAAIAHYIESKLGQMELTSVQWMQLLHQARSAKEFLLKNEADPELPFSVLLEGAGSRIVEGSLSLEISQQELRLLLIDGFFAPCSWSEALNLRKTGGMRSIGLPYEDEPNILKQLARFLQQNYPEVVKKPDYILFNGGAMKPPSFQQAVIDALDQWFPGKGVVKLETVSLDLAVARGAAYYGKGRRGLGVRIGGGTARSTYLEVTIKEGENRALTLLPRGAEEGSCYEPSETFWLTPNTPIAFRLYSSHVRLHDSQGSLIPIDLQEMQPLPPIHTILRFGKRAQETEKIPVHLQVESTAIGTLALWLKALNTDHRWSLEFQLRGSAKEARTDETFETRFLVQAQELISQTFVSKQIKPSKLMESLESCLQMPRKEWSLSVLRGLWESLLKVAPQRKASPEYEARWWNLAGYLLRPGFGFPLDDFRLKELWKVILGDLQSRKSSEVLVQSWICFRRIAGGLTKGQQMQLAAEILPTFLLKSGKIELKGKEESYFYSEKVRTIGAMELLDNATKVRLGEALLKRIEQGEGAECDYWTLGRLGARHLLYGSIGCLIPSKTCAQWVERLLALKVPHHEELTQLLSQLARKTDQREANLPTTLIEKVLSTYQDSSRLQQLLTAEESLTIEERDHLFGDQLPAGLTLLHDPINPSK